MTTRHSLASLPFALCLPAAVLWADSVKASDHIGGTCVPDSATVREGKYETAGFGVRFGGNNIGKIRLLCLLHDTMGGDVEWVTWLSVIDEDGMEAGARVRAHFRRAAIGTNVWIAIGTCDSNTSDIKVPHKLECQLPPYKVRRVFEWYWWDVEIERTDPKVNVEFLGVGIRYRV
jgi:hypothetical protein